MVADFFVLRLDQMNECTHDFLDGINPLDSSEQNEDVITIKNILEAIEESSINRDKLYLYLDYSPSVIELYDDGSYATLCKGYEEVCKSQTQTCDWCSDSLESLNKKGTYMRQHSKGLVLSFIDLDAYDDKWCDCKKSFPGFYAILDGWNGVPVDSMQQCPLFDKNDIC
ncbi:uncharacterized protein LOC126838671 [Adelges cooleyi]|uniref:uncharacterized protein LOC126838671 n=1 Tax=Adelges cooleyi TaxID=133065 RepID=UPI00217FB83A|nr:uncharacterized protein LOC126838671 [Adelges cooleyi]